MNDLRWEAGAGGAGKTQRANLAAGKARMKRKTLLIGVSALAMSAAHVASAQNLVANGSFEGANGLSGWSIGGIVGDGAQPVAIAYNQSSNYPTGAQGEIVPTDDAPSASPDSAGNNGVYFVSDAATGLSVYQKIFLAPGSYKIGFDSYDTFNGAVQPYDANLTANIAGVQLASFDLSFVDPGIWTTHAGTASISVAGYYEVSFAFTTPNFSLTSDPPEFPAKDVVIDRAYVIDTASGGTPITPAIRLYWDGDAAANTNNNQVDGGNGTWTTASTNFTEPQGTTNGSYYAQPGSVIFEAAPGTVTVDDTPGQVAVTGMQFAVNGYDVTGAPIALSGANATIQVGDGTAAGAGDTATVAAALTGTSSLTKTDLGTLVLSGLNSYTGGTTIAGGTLSIDNANAIGAGALQMAAGTTLAFTGPGFTLSNDIALVDAGDPNIDSGAGSETLTGVISGPGALSKLGTGILTLDNTETYTGGTEVQAGTLEIGDAATPTAQLATGLVTVDPKATLGGYGTIGGSVTNNGTLDNNNNFAALGLTIDGNYTQGTPGNLLIGVTPDTASLLQVGGAAALAGSVNFAFAAGTYHEAALKFLAATGGVTGTFSTITTSGANPAGLNIGVAYLADEADLVLSRPTLIVAPNNPAIYSAQSFAFTSQNETASIDLMNRTEANGGGNSFYNMALQPGPQTRVWIEPDGNAIDAGHTGSGPGFNAQSGGLQAGTENTVGATGRLGLALGYEHETLNDGDGGKGHGDAFRANLYGSQPVGVVGLSAVLGYSHGWNTAERYTGDGRATANYGISDYSGGVQAALPFSLAGITLTPAAGALLSHLSSGSFSEHGAPAGFNVSGSAKSETIFSPYVTFGASYAVTTQSGVVLTPDAQIGYRHDQAAHGQGFTLNAADGTAFADNRVRLDEDNALLGASLTARKGNMTAYLKYRAQLAGNVTDESAQIGFRYAF